MITRLARAFVSGTVRPEREAIEGGSSSFENRENEILLENITIVEAASEDIPCRKSTKIQESASSIECGSPDPAQRPGRDRVWLRHCR